MKYRVVAIPLASFLLALSVSPTGQSQSDPAPVNTANPSAQAPAPPAAKPASNLSDEQQADLFMARKEYKEAAVAYKQLAGRNPRNAAYMNKLGIAYHQMVMLGPAMKCYERAVKVDPTYADAINNIGTVWFQRKKYGKAIKAYQKALGVRPEMAVLYSNLGYAYFADLKYEEAIAAFRHALAIDPELFEHASSRNASLLQDRSVADRGRFYFLLAKSFAQAGNPERCVHYLRKSRDEGYTSFSSVKTDPAFSAVLSNPEVQDLLAPPPAETAKP